MQHVHQTFVASKGFDRNPRSLACPFWLSQRKNKHFSDPKDRRRGLANEINMSLRPISLVVAQTLILDHLNYLLYTTREIEPRPVVIRAVLRVETIERTGRSLRSRIPTPRQALARLVIWTERVVAQSPLT